MAMRASKKHDNPQARKRTPNYRIIDVLELLGRAPNTPAPEISKKLQIPLPTVYRFVETLLDSRLLVASPNGNLEPGPRLRRMLWDTLSCEPMVLQRMVVLAKLSNEIRETCNLSIPQESGLVYFCRHEFDWPVQTRLNVGDQLPLWCSASGKLYLSTLNDDQCQRILRNLPLTKIASNTITDVDRLFENLDEIRELGFSLDNEEWLDGMTGAAVPIRDPNGIFRASLSIHALAVRKPYGELIRYIPIMKRAARELENVFFGSLCVSAKESSS
jgi:IclR family transcriptional regulator, acetate operon repressor